MLKIIAKICVNRIKNRSLYIFPISYTIDLRMFAVVTSKTDGEKKECGSISMN